MKAWITVEAITLGTARVQCHHCGDCEIVKEANRTMADSRIAQVGNMHSLCKAPDKHASDCPCILQKLETRARRARKKALAAAQQVIADAMVPTPKRFLGEP